MGKGWKISALSLIIWREKCLTDMRRESKIPDGKGLNPWETGFGGIGFRLKICRIRRAL